MSPLKRSALLGTGALGVLALWVCWVSPNRPPAAQLPKGVSLAEALRRGGEQAPKGWYTNWTGPRHRFMWPITWPMFRFEMKQLLGRCPMVIPNPARDLDLRYNLADCSRYSGETYLLAKELFPDGYADSWPHLDFNLAYQCGGTNQPRRLRDWIAANEAALVRNGVIGLRKKNPLPTAMGVDLNEPFITNQCAIIRDCKGIVKIVPLDYLRAYKDAGLLTVLESKRRN